jgi:hypothetical protein
MCSYLPAELNILLIPDDLVGKSNSEICSYLKENKSFMRKVCDFRYRMLMAKRYSATGKCYCLTKVCWKPSIVINQSSMTKYFDYTANVKTGFSFIISKAYEIKHKERVCGQMRQEGKTCCDYKN